MKKTYIAPSTLLVGLRVRMLSGSIGKNEDERSFEQADSRRGRNRNWSDEDEY